MAWLSAASADCRIRRVRTSLPEARCSDRFTLTANKPMIVASRIRTSTTMRVVPRWRGTMPSEWFRYMSRVLANTQRQQCLTPRHGRTNIDGFRQRARELVVLPTVEAQFPAERDRDYVVRRCSRRHCHCRRCRQGEAQQADIDLVRTQ